MLSPRLAIKRISKLLSRIEPEATAESSAAYAAATSLISQLVHYNIDHREDQDNIRAKLTDLAHHTNGCYGLCDDSFSTDSHRMWCLAAISALSERYMFGEADHP